MIQGLKVLRIIKQINQNTTYPWLSSALPNIDPVAVGDGDNSSWQLEINLPEDEAKSIIDQMVFCTPSMALFSPNDFVIPYISYNVYFKCKILKLKLDFVDMAFCPFIFSIEINCF